MIVGRNAVAEWVYVVGGSGTDTHEEHGVDLWQFRHGLISRNNAYRRVFTDG